MKQLNKPSDNLGGLLKIWLVPPANVSSLKNGILTLSSTTNVYQVYCSLESLRFIEPSDNTPAGLLYKPSIQGIIPKDSIDVQTAIAELNGQKRLVVFIDGNENYKVAGSKECPLRVLFDFDSGKNTSDLNAHTIKVSGSSTTKSQFISNPF